MKLYHGTNKESFLNIMNYGFIQSTTMVVVDEENEFLTYFARTFEQAFLHGVYVFEIDVTDEQLFFNFIDMNDETNENDFATKDMISVYEKPEHEDELKVSNIFIPNVNYNIDKYAHIYYDLDEPVLLEKIKN